MPLPGAVKDFLGKPAPVGYVAGVGRGATGFVTRADIGPHIDTAQDSLLDTIDTLPEQSLFPSKGPLDAQDIEAEAIYSKIDKHMEERRKSRKESHIFSNTKQHQKIQEQFEDLKDQLKQVTEEEWNSIPDVVGDYRAKRMKKSDTNKRGERYTPIPDHIILSNLRTIDQDGSFTSDSIFTDIKQLGQARERQFGHKLDQLVSGIESVDSTGYLTGLATMTTHTTSEMIDIKRGIALLSSLVATHPDSASGWISLVRLEEQAGKITQARDHISQACIQCSQSEDIWLEASRLYPSEAQDILLKATSRLSSSVKLWMKAASLKSDIKEKKVIMRKALESIPTSVQLWKAFIELEDEQENVRILLARAIECIPTCVEFYLALSKLESVDNARRVLNKARQACPSSHEIWIAASKLEESNKQDKTINMINTLIHRCIASLEAKGASLSREHWIREAENSERDGYILTCRAIIDICIGMNIEEQDRLSTWLEDAETRIINKCIETARAIYNHAIEEYSKDDDLWETVAFFEREHGTRERLSNLLERAIINVPISQTLWLMFAKEKWLSGDVNAAREIINAALNVHSNSEQVWLAAIKLEQETGEFKRAEELLNKARIQVNTGTIWIKSALLFKQIGDIERCITTLQEGLNRFPQFEELWIMLAKIYENNQEWDMVHNVYSQAVHDCSESSELWRLLASFHAKRGNILKARAILEHARHLHSKVDNIWLDSIRLEYDQEEGNKIIGKTLLAKSLHELSHSGILWSEAIYREPRATKKSKATDAWRKCHDDALVALAIGKMFWDNRELNKAKSWIERAMQLNGDLEDVKTCYQQFQNEQNQ